MTPYDQSPEPAAPDQVTLAVLAGGAGTRMGMPKAMLRVNKRPMLSWLLSSIDWPGPTLLVTAPSTGRPPGSDDFARHAVDPADGIGPLQGVLTALRNSDTPLLAIITVDMPGIDRPRLLWLLKQLAGHPDRAGVMCRRDAASAQIEPFPCALRQSARRIVEDRLLAGRRSVHGLCDDSSVVAVVAPSDWPARTWLNLNHPAEFAAFHHEQSNRQEEI